LLKIGW